MVVWNKPQLQAEQKNGPNKRISIRKKLQVGQNHGSNEKKILATLKQITNIRVLFLEQMELNLTLVE